MDDYYMHNVFLWNSHICDGCSQQGYYFGILYDQNAIFFCKTCKNIIHQFMRYYRKYHMPATITQYKQHELQCSNYLGAGFCVESTNLDTTNSIMSHFMEWVTSGVCKWQDRRIWLLSDQPHEHEQTYLFRPRQYSSSMELFIHSPIESLVKELVTPLTLCVVTLIRSGAIDLNNSVISDVDKYIFDMHNAIIAIRYLFSE
ncbi:hypothetical protein F-M6_0269 [Faustovirus]|nr:hypothetical protein F-M6_0269 [Faustovirus]